MSSLYQISSLNPSSSAALLDRSLDDVYTPYVCNSSKVPLLRHYVVAPVLLHLCRGVVAPWHGGAMAPYSCGAGLHRLYDYTTLRPTSVVFIDNVRTGTFPHTQSSRVWIMSLFPLLFNYVDKSWAMGVEKNFVFCFESQQWYQSRSMHSCTSTVRTHRGWGRWFSYCYPFMCIYSCLWHCWIASGPWSTLRETGSTTDVWLASYKWLGEC
jgi:hypothetical protein